ncbi:hypothetical protein ACSTH9_23450, partial [Vibrio parahaemolyticus]
PARLHQQTQTAAVRELVGFPFGLRASGHRPSLPKNPYPELYRVVLSSGAPNFLTVSSRIRSSA